MPMNRGGAGLAGGFGLGAVSGFILATTLLTNDSTSPQVPTVPRVQPDVPLPAGGQGDPAVPGVAGDPGAPARPDLSAGRPGGEVLRQGDTGSEVLVMQQRLLQVPNLYSGDTDGHYDVDVTAAVARFQQWYGVRGDETGVYGESTRRDLEARTH